MKYIGNAMIKEEKVLNINQNSGAAILTFCYSMLRLLQPHCDHISNLRQSK